MSEGEYGLSGDIARGGKGNVVFLQGMGGSGARKDYFKGRLRPKGRKRDVNFLEKKDMSTRVTVWEKANPLKKGERKFTQAPAKTGKKEKIYFLAEGGGRGNRSLSRRRGTTGVFWKAALCHGKGGGLFVEIRRKCIARRNLLACVKEGRKARSEARFG